LEIEVIKNKKLLVKWLSDKGLDGLDINKSLQDRSRWSINVDGERIYCPKLKDLAEAINSKLSVNIDPTKSRPLSINATKIVYYKGDIPLEEETLQEEIISTEVQEEEKVEIPSEELSLEKISKEEVNWEWIEALPDSQQGKKDLAFYADKHFGIHLKKNVKMSSMIGRFKAALEQS